MPIIIYAQGESGGISLYLKKGVLPPPIENKTIFQAPPPPPHTISLEIFKEPPKHTLLYPLPPPPPHTHQQNLICIDVNE